VCERKKSLLMHVKADFGVTRLKGKHSLVANTWELKVRQKVEEKIHATSHLQHIPSICLLSLFSSVPPSPTLVAAPIFSNMLLQR
jgi:hypothetical protein